MQQRHDWPNDISDEAIKTAFTGANSVSFSSRHFNHISHRSITFGNLGRWLPLTRVLPLIGITPQMLRPVFNHQHKIVKRRFPFNLTWFGLNKNQVRFVKVELPEYIDNYEQLGGFPLTNKPFQGMAKILGKSVKVLREDGGTGDHYALFIAHPSGEIVKATRA